MRRPLNQNLPADLPENWARDQIVAPTGEEVGLSSQHGYNYLGKSVNDAQKAINTLNQQFDNVQEDLTKANTTNTIADADSVLVEQTVSQNKVVNKISFSNLIATIKTKLQTVFAAIVHSHGSITNAGAIGTVADKAIFTGANGVLKADVLPILAGGTGATSKVGANTNLTVAGTDIAPATDLPADYPIGIHLYLETSASKLPYKPTDTGTLLSVKVGNDVSHLWFSQSSGMIFRRRGNSTGWNSSATLPTNRGWVVVATREASSDTLTTVYLSPTGNDNASGLSVNTPMKTIRAAVAKYAGLNRVQLTLAAGTYTYASAVIISGIQHVTISGGTNNLGGVVITHPIIFQSTDAYLYRVAFNLSASALTDPCVTLRQSKYNIHECVFNGKADVHAGINASLGSTGYIFSCQFQSGKTGVELGSGSSMSALDSSLAAGLEIGFNVNGATLISSNNANSGRTQFTMYNSAVIFNNGLLLNQAANTYANAEVVEEV